MKKLIFALLTIGSFLVGVPKSYSAVCDCGAPPECGPSRPPHCPLEEKTLKCEGAIAGTFKFNENLSPRSVSETQEVMQFTPSNSNNPFFDGEAVLAQASGDNFVVNYWFESAYCTLHFSIHSDNDPATLRGSTDKVTFQCDDEIIDQDSVCKIEMW